MKYSLIVHDVTAESLPQILARLNGTTAVTAVANQTTAEDDAGVADNATVDADGIVWDGRIHASTKTKVKDGRWKRAKNVPDEVFEAVKAELKANVAAPQAQPSSPNAAFAGAPVVGQGTPQAQPVATAGAPAPQSNLGATLTRLENQMGITPQGAPAGHAPQAQPVAAPAPQAQPTPPAFDPNDRSFNAFTQKMGRLYGGNHVAPEYTNNLVFRINTDWQPYGKQIATITDIANDAQLLEYAWKILDVDGFTAV